MACRVLSVSKSNAENRSYTKKLELQNKLLLETNEELQKAAQSRAELLARLSHDFRKTLNVIIGFTELMLDEKTGEVSQEQRDSLNDVLSGSRRLLYLINSYLE